MATSSCKFGDASSLEEIVQRWFDECQPRLVDEAEHFMLRRETFDLCVTTGRAKSAICHNSRAAKSEWPSPAPPCEPSVGDVEVSPRYDDYADLGQGETSETCTSHRPGMMSSMVTQRPSGAVAGSENHRMSESTAVSESAKDLVGASSQRSSKSTAAKVPKRFSMFSLMGVGGGRASSRSSEIFDGMEAHSVLVDLARTKTTFERSVQLNMLDDENSWWQFWKNFDAHQWLYILDQVMAIVVVLNILQLALNADVERQWGGWLVFDCAFAIAFLVEFLVKWNLRGWVVHFVVEWRWTLFDGAIVVVAITELVYNVSMGGDAINSEAQWGTSISVLRVVRLLRLVRIIRVLRLPIFKDLLMMLDGLIGGSRTLFWSFILLLVPVFSSALLLRETIGESTDAVQNTLIVSPFGNLPTSVFTVFRCIMGDCSAESGQPLSVLMMNEYGWGYGFSYICLIVITSFGLFNVIIAIYVENIVVAAKKNESIQRQRRMRDTDRLHELLAQLVHEFARILDASDARKARSSLRSNNCVDIAKAAKMEITRKIFDDVTKKESVRNIFDHLEIPYEDRLDLFDVLDADGSGTLTLGEVVEGLKKLRGDPRRSDLIALGLAIRAMQRSTRADSERILNSLKKTSRAFTSIFPLPDGHVSEGKTSRANI